MSRLIGNLSEGTLSNQRILDSITDLESQLDATNEFAGSSIETLEVADQLLQTNLTSETDARLSADTILQDSITAETFRATTAEQALNLSLDQAILDRVAVDDLLLQNQDAEAIARYDADVGLQNQVTLEILNRTNADTAIQNELDQYKIDNLFQIDTENVESTTDTLNIACDNQTTTLNMGAGSGVQVVNIGTGSGVTTINLGGVGDNLVVQGTLITNNVMNNDVADKNIKLNVGGTVGSAFGGGLDFEEGGVTTGYIRISDDRTSIDLQPPNGNLIVLNQSLTDQDSPSFNQVTADSVVTPIVGTTTNTQVILGANSLQNIVLLPNENTEMNGDLVVKNGASVKFQNVSNTHSVGIRAPTLASSSSYTLPSTQATTGQVLTSSDGTGTLAWKTSGSSNVPSTIVERDGSGNFVANQITANLTGNASTATLASNVTTNANLTGEVTSVGNATTLSNSAVIGKVLTGFNNNFAGVVTATDSLKTAIEKINSNQITATPSSYFYYTADSNAVSQSMANNANNTVNFGTVRANTFGSNLTVTGTNTYANSSGQTMYVTVSVAVRTDSTVTSLFNMWIQTTGGLNDSAFYGQVALTKGATIQASTICSTLLLPNTASFRVGFYQNSGSSMVIGGPFAPLSSVITISTASGTKGETGATGPSASFTGEVTSVGTVATLDNSAVINKVLTGYTKSVGTLSSSDSIRSAIQKVDANTLVPKGTWSSSVPYAINDIVSYNGGLYSALAPSTNIVPGVSVNQSIFAPSAFGISSVTDVNIVNVTLTFKPLVNGYINGCSYYRYPTSTNTKIGRLWDNVGNQLASVTFVGETASGLQSQLFGAPVPVTAGVTYVVGYNAQYRWEANTYTAYPITNTAGTLQALSSGWSYGSYPTTNFGVDVLFATAVSWITMAPPVALTGEVTSVGNAATLTNSAVIGKVLTGYVSGAGTISASDTILQAVQKLNGNQSSSSGTAAATANTLMLRDSNADTAVRDISVRRVIDSTALIPILDTLSGSQPTNTFIGRNAGNQTTSSGGSANTLVGKFCGTLIGAGTYNCGMGYGAFNVLSTGANNTAIGVSALSSITTQSDTTGIGAQAGYNNTGGQCTFLGAYTDSSVPASWTNSTAVGYGAKVTASNQMQLGNASLTQINTSGALSCGALSCTGVTTGDISGTALTLSGSLHYWNGVDTVLRATTVPIPTTASNSTNFLSLANSSGMVYCVRMNVMTQFSGSSMYDFIVPETTMGWFRLVPTRRLGNASSPSEQFAFDISKSSSSTALIRIVRTGGSSTGYTCRVSMYITGYQVTPTLINSNYHDATVPPTLSSSTDQNDISTIGSFATTGIVRAVPSFVRYRYTDLGVDTYNTQTLTSSIVPIRTFGETTASLIGVSGNTFTIPHTGWYKISYAFTYWTSGTFERVFLYLFVNGSNQRNSLAQTFPNNVGYNAASEILNLTAGDTVELRANISAGSSNIVWSYSGWPNVFVQQDFFMAERMN